MSHDASLCPECRRSIRRSILDAFASNPRWLGREQIRMLGRLGWVPEGLYLESLAGAAALGVLVVSFGHDDDFPRFLPWWFAAGDSGNSRRPRSAEGGAR